MKNYIFTLLFLLSISTQLFSQTNNSTNDSISLKNQFDNLINNSNNYQDFKVVKLSFIQKLKSNVIDSISLSKKDILNSKSIINSQINTIDSLKTVLSTTNADIELLNSEIQSISFFGIPFEKSLFKTVMLTVIGILILALIYFISKFKLSNNITKQTKLNLINVEEEFEEHRKKALEREQKVMRRLQDELNKQKKD